MIGLRAALTVFLSSAAAVSTVGGNDIGQTFRAHPVWIQEGLVWEQDPGEKQSWADGEILYFGSDGRFGMFGGVILKRGTRLALSEGEGEIVHAGTWKVKDDAIQIDYRLVGMYKVIPPKGEKPPDIPGPVKHAEAKLNAHSPMHLELEGKKYAFAAGFRASELRERLQVYTPADTGTSGF